MLLPAWRQRAAFAAQALALMALGLAWRKVDVGMPYALWKYGGDAIWAWLFAPLWGVLRPGSALRERVVAAVVLSSAVEVSQLFHAPWLEAIRDTTLGGLAIGTRVASFAWGDLAAYAVGIAAGATLSKKESS